VSNGSEKNRSNLHTGSGARFSSLSSLLPPFPFPESEDLDLEDLDLVDLDLEDLDLEDLDPLPCKPYHKQNG